MPVCDGCGSVVDDEHIRRRIQRLEQATRFRPIHIQFLLLDASPPPDPRDFFYHLDAAGGGRSVPARMYFAELSKLAGAGSASGLTDEATLTDFQHRGLFLAHAVECPIENEKHLSEAVRKFARTVVLRVRSSYKPKHIVLISQATQELIHPLRDGELGERLVLDSEGPFVDPFIGDPQNQAEFGTSLGDRLVAALSKFSI